MPHDIDASDRTRSLHRYRFFRVHPLTCLSTMEKQRHEHRIRAPVLLAFCRMFCVVRELPRHERGDLV